MDYMDAICTTEWGTQGLGCRLRFRQAGRRGLFKPVGPLVVEGVDVAGGTAPPPRHEAHGRRRTRRRPGSTGLAGGRETGGQGGGDRSTSRLTSRPTLFV
jgi:hypothetical protein